MTILVTGASGQLGLDLVDAFSAACGADQVVAASRHDLDVTDPDAVAAFVARVGPEIVVNAAAMTDVDGCEDNPVVAHTANALAPWWLAQACARVGGRLVTISTDYVFAGDADDGPYTEFDPVHPINTYGKTKAAGEALVRQTLADHQIVRTAWLAGARGRNFVTTVLRAAATSSSLSMVDDQFGSPTYTRDLADAVVQLALDGKPGTWHRTNRGVCSRFELATTLLSMAGMSTPIERRATVPDERPARRPARVELDDTHAIASGLSPLPDWRDGMRRLLAELESLDSGAHDPRVRGDDPRARSDQDGASHTGAHDGQGTR
ncbi:MAG: dTDP-4-dehydrorhamnose reductase [Nitriliruptoraceae bacterium]